MCADPLADNITEGIVTLRDESGAETFPPFYRGGKPRSSLTRAAPFRFASSINGS